MIYSGDLCGWRRGHAGLVLLALVFVAVGCAYTPSQGVPHAVTSTATIDPDQPRQIARLEAKGRAELEARRQIADRAAELRLSDGRTLGDLAVIDPFVRAALDDTVRAAVLKPVRDEEAPDVVTVTLHADLQPLYDLVRDYPKYAIK